MRTRLVETADATALMAIYNPEVLETTNTFDLVPRSLTEQREWIVAHQSSHPCFVAINESDEVGEVGAHGERILGFAVFSPFRSRPAYASTVENSVYVHRAARGRGVGELLMKELISTAKISGYHAIIARIVGENGGSIRLHEKVGFTLVGTEIEVGRKHNRWLDVVEYQYVVPDGRD
ncbi:MAG: GNAT family N-acetyltransferase [Actinomycetota bacterium]|jgi:phosphinothricin acetyltransferase|nr:GNAT family N-acetyltransferase [Actinomycetota bacterium]